jgi:CRISPR-associated exonuclease Cas4
MYAEDDLVPISALQHPLYCERQFALIHVEQQFALSAYHYGGM